MISKKFIHSSLIYSIIGALPLASSVILLPFYTNLLSVSDVGILMLYISFSYFIQIMVNFALDTNIGISYFDYKNDKKKLNEYIGTVVILLLLIGSFFVLFSFLLGDKIFNFIFEPGTLSFFPYGFMSVITAIFNSLFKTYTNLLINKQEPWKFFFLNISNFFLTISISIYGLYLFPNSLDGPILGRLLSGLVIFIMALFLFIKEYGIKFNPIFLKGIYLFCLPMVLYYLLSWVLSYISPFIVNEYLTPKDVGIFNFAVTCTLLMEYVHLGLANSIMPKVFSLWKENDSKESTVEMNKYFNGYTALNILGLPLFIVIIPIIVPIIVTNKDFYESFSLLGVLSLGFVFRGLYNMFLGPIYFYKKTKVLPKVFLFSAILQIGITIVLIKSFGLYGVIWANFISKPFQVFFLYLESRKIFKFKFNLMKQILLPSLFIILIIITEIIMVEEYRLLIELVLLILTFILVFFIYKKEILLLLEFIKLKRPPKFNS